jgi:hypothetical protein
VIAVKNCEESPGCYETDIEKLDQYIYNINCKISEYNSSSICTDSWGYACSNVNKKSFEELMIFRYFLKQHRKSLAEGYSCQLCPEEVQNVLEASFYHIDSKFDKTSDVVISKEGFDEWVINNPTCVAWEDWERGVNRICKRIGIEVTNASDNYKFVYEILSKSLNDSCVLYYTLDVVSKAIEQKCFDVSIKNIASCKVDYDLIVSNTDCDLSFEMYMKMLSKNLSSTVIHNLYSSGGSLKLLSNEVHISINGISCKISDVTVNSKSSTIDGELVGRVLRTESENSLEIIQNLKNSYNNIVC